MSLTHLDEHEIFSVAVHIQDPQAREVYLAQACGNDMALFDRVSSLVATSQRESKFLEEPPPGLHPTIDIGKSTEFAGKQIGRYKILQEIGKGGFGVVYMAEQSKPVRRKVALKIIKPGMDTDEVVARFDAERQALALMDHPNIARVLDAGATDTGHPFFVMELVKGVSITQYADDNNLSTRQRLQLLQKVCRAVQHAHQKGVIHRDIKPSNVLITLHDGEPVPKVIDFGVAKAISQQLTDRTLFTRFGQVIGTPQYMSPEQAEMSGLDVDTRSDVYSIGVLMYEMLVGQPPFDGKLLQSASLDEMRRMIREEDPSVPSNLIRTLDVNTATTVATHRSCERESLCRELTGELDWITMKALEKDRNRRYETASDLADDMQRHFDGEAVEAGPVTWSYLAQKIWNRHQPAILGFAACSLALIMGLLVAIGALMQVSTALAQETAAKTEAEKQRVVAVTEAKNTTRTLELVLEILSMSGVNPATGKEYTVSEALDRIGDRVDAGFDLQPDTAAELCLGLARAFLSTGQRDRAGRNFDRALELGQTAGWKPDDERLAEARRESAYMARSIERLMKAADKDRKIDNKIPLRKTLVRLGSLAYDENQLELAYSAIQEAKNLFPADTNDLKFVDIPHFILADVKDTHGNFDEAQKIRESGVELCRSLFSDNDGEWFRTALSLSKAREFAAADRAFFVAGSCEQKASGSWIKFLGHRLKDVGHFALADRAYALAANVADQGQDVIEEQIRILASRARLRFAAHNFTEAESYYKQALKKIDAAEAEDETSLIEHYWPRIEYAYLLYGIGREKEGDEQIKIALAFVKKHTDVFRNSRHQYNRLKCLTLLGRSDEIRDELIGFLGRDTIIPESHSTLIFHVAWRSPDFGLGDINTIEPRKFGCLSWQPHQAAYSQFFEDAFVQELSEVESENAATDFLRKLIKRRDAFHPRTPTRAWTRVRLAKILLANSSGREEARRLFQEAIEILETHPFVPHDEIRKLLAMAESAQDDED
ncbi:protein kinase [Stieleria sp. ICT_E10.1]|uniref:serine/threonine protein kinase n=1 Tax=Stieleria sedimenti TaxID=2976331 RepID=UPI00217FA6DF|nr:serine/threonine-protein kinase [Stieleria sedimenti]MCS7471590.1 protein kinase [Stieleria sedimenti]